ncbi:MAG: BofC C-terminal domain-containing protein [Bacillota bacterium]|nr:MAG: hypothetical protein DIU66_10450 [Bacillota bacterium]
MPKKIAILTLLVALLAAAGFLFGYYSIRFESQKAEDRSVKNTETVQLPEEALEAGAKVIFITRYEECGHEERNEVPADGNYEGYTESRLREEFKEWKLEAFSHDEAVLTRSVDGLCEEHYYIGIYEGYVALFQGKPGKDSKLLELTDIKAGILKEEDRKLLEDGIVINSRDEFLKIREGLTH